MKATPRWLTSICCGWATPARTSGSSREELKQTLTPVYRAYLEDFYSRAENRTQPGVVYLLGDPAPSPQGSWQQTLQSLEEVYNRMQEQTQGALALQTGDCYSYLLSHEMIDAAPSSVKANVTFSTLIYSLNTPFLFANMDGSAEDVFSVSHEFGHCYAMWRQLQQGSHEEGAQHGRLRIHSQAMQILTMPFYEEFYGEEAGTARRYDVYTVVAGILTAALNDEFQEEVYANPDLTVEQLNELYASLAAEYGLVVDSLYFDMDSFSKGWFTTNQYFDSPFYAIDYALSGCVAMQFLQMGLQDYGAALKTYEALVTPERGRQLFDCAGGGGAGLPVCGGDVGADCPDAADLPGGGRQLCGGRCSAAGRRRGVKDTARTAKEEEAR